MKQSARVEPAQSTLIFGDQLWLDGENAVARRRDPEFAETPLHCLLGMSVATIPRTCWVR